MASAGSAPRSTLLERYVHLLVLAIVVVGLSAMGVMLLVTCETTQSNGPSGNLQIGCTYPFQTYGETFLLAAGIVGTLTIVPLWRIADAGGHRYDWDPWIVTVLIDAGFVVVYGLVLLLT